MNLNSFGLEAMTNEELKTVSGGGRVLDAIKEIIRILTSGEKPMLS